MKVKNIYKKPLLKLQNIYKTCALKWLIYKKCKNNIAKVISSQNVTSSLKKIDWAFKSSPIVKTLSNLVTLLQISVILSTTNVFLEHIN